MINAEMVSAAARASERTRRGAVRCVRREAAVTKRAIIHLIMYLIYARRTRPRRIYYGRHHDPRAYRVLILSLWQIYRQITVYYLVSRYLKNIFNRNIYSLFYIYVYVLYSYN